MRALTTGPVHALGGLVLASLSLACSPGSASSNPQEIEKNAPPDSGPNSGSGTPQDPAKKRPDTGFDEDRAWAHLEAQVAFGPRISGTPGAEQCRRYLESQIRAMDLRPRREPFTATPIAATGFDPIRMANVVTEIEGRPQDDGSPAPILLFASHYDTKRKNPPNRFEGEILGANDGASSSAVLLELARVLREGAPHAFTYRFVWFDGEEALRWSWIDPDNRYGSKHHVQRMKDNGEWDRLAALVLLDLVGDAELELQDDLNSDRTLKRAIFSTAREHGLGKYVAGPAERISDDHLSFIEAGFTKVVDLIDLNYPDLSNRYWHSPEDTLEHCSKESLSIVGDIVLLSLPELERVLSQ